MKKLYLLFLILTFSATAKGQSGSGTEADPFYGTISSSVIWNAADFTNGTVYVGNTGRIRLNLTIGSNGSLTINEGVIVIFKETASNLIITGSGVLTVNGTISNKVIFKKHPSQTNWGHILFNAPTGTSVIDHCIIQDGLGEFGGGIYIYSTLSNVTLKNTLIHDCATTSFGGGIEIEASDPVIENCIIRNNTGAGIDIYDGTPVITNCTFVNNNNPNTGEYGGIHITSGTPVIKNCILWNNTQGSNTDRDYSGGGGSISFSAATQAITGTGMIDLSSVNTDPTGPNFTDPATSDYSISFISPCRDAGTTPDPAISTDILGNSRIYNYDIGAYEVKYSRWTGSSDTEWTTTANWSANVDPATGTGDIIIPGGLTTYPVSSSNPDFTILSGKQMILEPGARVTLGNLTNNGTLKLNHNAAGFASLIINGYTRGTGGSEEIQLYVTGGGSEFLEDYKWHYISSPVTSLSVSEFSSATLDLAQFIESRVALNLMQGWVAYDGYVYSTGQTNGPTFSTLTPGKGYNFWDDVDSTFTFGGLFSTSDLDLDLEFTSNTPAERYGFNLLGNPFSSGLDWNEIINNSNYPLNTSKGLYFTRDNLQCSYVSGVGIPSDVTGIIPPMQGFFVKTYSTGNSLTIPAAARTHNNIHPRYKGETIIPLVRLAIFENSVSNDETVVRFDVAAKSTLDNDFDAVKMFLTPTKTSIHTKLGGIDYSINGQPFPESVIEIPVIVNLISGGTHKITASQLQGLDNYSVSLKDKTTGFTADLKTTPVVTFSASPGTLSDRFILNIINLSTGAEDLNSNDNSFNIYRNFNYINIQPVADEWDGRTGSVKVMDMSGKTVSDLGRIEFSKTSVTQTKAPDANGLYFIEIKSGANRFVGKVVIK